MGARPYRRGTMSLSAPLTGAIACGVLAALVWLVVVVLDMTTDLDLDFMSPVLFGLMVGVVVFAGLELRRNHAGWVRALGALMIAGAIVVVVAVLLVVGYAALLCGGGACN